MAFFLLLLFFGFIFVLVSGENANFTKQKAEIQELKNQNDSLKIQIKIQEIENQRLRKT
jgi:hypothetical protein